MGVKQYAMDGGQNYEDITRFTISQKDDISCGQYMSAKFGQQLVQRVVFTPYKDCLYTLVSC
jgi:hypothetical protein